MPTPRPKCEACSGTGCRYTNTVVGPLGPMRHTNCMGCCGACDGTGRAKPRRATRRRQVERIPAYQPMKIGPMDGCGCYSQEEHDAKQRPVVCPKTDALKIAKAVKKRMAMRRNRARR